MKKTITLLLSAFIIQFCIAQDSGIPNPVGTIGQGKGNQKESISARIPGSQNVSQGNCDSLQTTFLGGNNHRGNMFDIVAINEVTVTTVDAHPMADTDYEIYYKVGTFVGSENVAGDWTLVGSASGVVAQPTGTPTPVPITINITIPAGQTYAFYVTSTNTTISNNYTNGTTQGAVFSSDANMQILEGCGLEYPFSGAPFSPRVWNGQVHYCLGPLGMESILSTMSAEIYPNPVSSTGVISIHPAMPLKHGELKIYNVLGSEAGSMDNIHSNEINFNCGSLSAGMYYFVVEEENSLVSKGKFVVE